MLVLPVAGPGLPPNWYKGPSTARGSCASRARCCARTSASTCRDSVEVRVWDSSSEMRYWVLPAAARRHRGPRREGARRARHARLDDRHRPREPGLMALPAGRHRAGRRPPPRRGAASRRCPAASGLRRAVGAAGVRDRRRRVPRGPVRVERVPALADRLDQEWEAGRRRRALVVLRALAHGAGDRARGQRRALRRRPRRGDQVGARHAPQQGPPRGAPRAGGGGPRTGVTGR